MPWWVEVFHNMMYTWNLAVSLASGSLLIYWRDALDELFGLCQEKE